MDPVARAREIAARLAAAAIPGGDMLGKRKSRWEGDEDGGARPAPGMGERKRKKVYIPVDKYPDINFMGLLIGPRGSNQKRMEDESGARILIRGKGSSKVPTGDPDENEELHVLIQGDTDEAVAKAQSAVEDILFNPQQAMKLKQEQLRKVAELNGSVNDNYGPRGDGGDSRSGGGPAHYGPGSDGGPSSSIDMKVPRDLVGYIIGRGGETIRDLQTKSSAHIQIVREEEGAPQLPDRFVNITGSQESLDLAQRLIQNLIDERQQNQGGGGFRERDDRDRMARYGGVNPDGSETVELLVPNERVGLIIGRGGCTIKAIQQRTGTSVTIPQTPDPNHPDMRLITIRGTMEAKEAAKFEIQSMINEEPGQRHSYGMSSGQTIYMQVPNDRVGVVIGKRGETIKGIQDRHSVRIQIPQEADAGSDVRTISIQGPPQSLAGAKEEIDMVILQGAGGHGGYGGDSYGAQSGSYGDQSGSYGQQQQYGSYGAQGQQDQYAAYYQQQQGQYYQQDASATATTAAAGQTATATTTADPNDPNAYWNGYYEYAAYYGVDAANAAWGVTGAAAQASAEAYQQYQQQAGVAAGPAGGDAATASGDASTAAPGATSDAPAATSSAPTSAPATAAEASSAPASAPSQTQGPPGTA